MVKKPQLVLLHFAGGNCYSFQFLAPLLRDFEVLTPELPGRGKRSGMPLLKDFNLAAEDIYQQLAQKLTAPVFVMYGHSMGAYLALRVCRMLEQAGRTPAYCIVSGNPGPGIKSGNDTDTKKYLLGEQEFIEELRVLGGVPEEVLENKELFDFFSPILRADFEIAEENHMENEPPVKAPLFAMMGSSEKKVNKIINWAKFTQSRFDYEILEGDHFFIFRHPQRMAAIIRHCYFSAGLVSHP